MMLKSYLVVALRGLRRRKAYTGLNVAGLAVGLACCLLIVVFVRDELSFDRFHTRADRIYRVVMTPEGQATWGTALMPLGPALEAAFPEVEASVRVQDLGAPLVQHETQRFHEEHFLHADPAFFTVFDFPLVAGDAATALARPFTVVVTESAARRYFGDDDPVGQTLVLDNADLYEVTGVAQDPPHNTHLRFDFVASLASVPVPEERLWSRIALTYVLLDAQNDAAALSARLGAFAQAQLPPRWSDQTTVGLIPLADLHLKARLEREPVQGDIHYVYLFSAIAVVILLIACVNYMNLATAHATQRAREVGVRKTVGAHRRQLVAQFLGESVLLSSLALVLAVGLAELLLPVFSAWMDRPLTLDAGHLPFLAGLAGAAVLVGLLAGSYPAFLLSSFRPAHVLKGTFRARTLPVLRQGLVVFQFGAAAALVVAATVIDRQVDYVQQARLGFDQEHVVVLPVRDGAGENATAFMEQLRALPGVERVAGSYSVPGQPGAVTFIEGNAFEGHEGDADATFTFDHNWVGYGYVETLGLELAAGRSFGEAFGADEKTAVLINEAAQRKLGWADAVGKTIRLDGSELRVVGVVRDFHNHSLHAPIEPALFALHPAATRCVVVRLGPEQDLPRVLAGLEAVWDRFVPALPFQYTFLDQAFDAMYRQEERLGRLFAGFALLAVFVACLGLVGLAAFTAETRTKEIGIRKVLGASVAQLVVLLSRDFVRLVLFGLVVAFPVAYFAMQRWLEAFAYRIDLSWQLFALAAAAALVATVASVCYQALRAALADPVKALRYE